MFKAQSSMFKVLISVWLGYILIHGWIPYELIEIIRLGRIEVLPVCTEKLHDRQIELFHAHHHHLSHLVGTVWIEVGVILQSLSLVGISTVSYTHSPSPRDGLLSRMPSSA